MPQPHSVDVVRLHRDSISTLRQFQICFRSERPSEIVVEKLAAIPRGQVGDTIGQADAATLRQVDRALLLLLDLA